MIVKEWLIKTYEKNPYDILIRKRVICKDGFSISIQGSRAHYCCPRRTLDNGEYESLELGYSSEHEELLAEYEEGTIYPYVPIDIVEKVIKKHGGIIEQEKWERNIRKNDKKR